MPPLLPEAFAVSRGSHLPRRPAAEYRAAAAEEAMGWAQPGDSETVALARAVTGRSEITAIFYHAAGVAHLLETLDIFELVPSDRPNASLRYTTWASMLELARPHRAPDEDLRDTVQRLVRENAAYRALWILIVEGP